MDFLVDVFMSCSVCEDLFDWPRSVDGALLDVEAFEGILGWFSLGLYAWLVVIACQYNMMVYVRRKVRTR